MRPGSRGGHGEGGVRIVMRGDDDGVDLRGTKNGVDVIGGERIGLAVRLPQGRRSRRILIDERRDPRAGQPSQALGVPPADVAAADQRDIERFQPDFSLRAPEISEALRGPRLTKPTSKLRSGAKAARFRSTIN
jgi:hypothetical protein